MYLFLLSILHLLHRDNHTVFDSTRWVGALLKKLIFIAINARGHLQLIFLVHHIKNSGSFKEPSKFIVYYVESKKVNVTLTVMKT